MKRLEKERSPYLRHAAEQKIDWYPWSEDAFRKASEEDKPVFLSTGAVWCHWCHVMAKESFGNEEIAGILNDNFVCIKLDRDEHPDIDRRYQQAVAAMGSAGGWPLSVFLMPDRRPFFGGTYFPPEDSHGRPGFGKIIRAVNDFYKTKKADVSAYADSVIEHLRSDESLPVEPDMAMLDSAVGTILAGFDSRNGGFGTFPKFPMPGALELLMSRYSATHDAAAASAVKKTLQAMAEGGFHDQLLGGFHRYSVDEGWFVPHFEKMADDNAWLLRNYVSAYSLFGDESFREAAEGILRFSRKVLSSPDGGFYASQDADVTPDDEGGYFTWTDADFRRVLDKEEHGILSLHFFSPRARMHHDESKYVLCLAKQPDEIADLTGISVMRIKEVISSGRKKLLSERDDRTAPFIDRTIYTSLNGIFITAYMNAYSALGDDSIREFGLLSLSRLLTDHFVDGQLSHCIGVHALLDDYIFLTEALISAYEATGERVYLERADSLMRSCIEKLWDSGSGGFYDSEEGLLGIKLKPIEDIPHPSANAVAIICLLKLYHATADGLYLRHAGSALKAFSQKAASFGLHAGSYFYALDEYFRQNS